MTLPKIIEREYKGIIIKQRAEDGYINATAMCKSHGKLWGHYWDTQPAKDFAAQLSADIGIAISELYQSLKGGVPGLQGTWIHPYWAGNLAQWVSTELAVKVSIWMWEWKSGNLPSEAGAWAAIERLANATHTQIEGIKTEVGGLRDRIEKIEGDVIYLKQKKKDKHFGREAKEIWRLVCKEHGGYDPSLPGKVKILDDNGNYLPEVVFDAHINHQETTVWDGWPVNSQDRNIELRKFQSRDRTRSYVDIFHDRIRLLFPEGKLPKTARKPRVFKYRIRKYRCSSTMGLPL